MPPGQSVSKTALRKARPGDIDVLMVLEERAFPGDRLSRRQMRYHLQNPKAQIWVCPDREDRPLAYLLAFFHEGRAPRLYSVAVSAAARGKGLGEQLVRQFLAEAKRRRAAKVILEVRTDSKAAIALYEKLGFRETRCLPGYYDDGCMGIKMLKTL